MRLRGLLLFLFIPLVLYLFLKQPLGTLASVFLGITIMLGHRFLAAPFSATHREQRCLWCGRDTPGPLELKAVVRSPRQDPMEYALCTPPKRDCGARWQGLHRLGIRGGVFMRLGIGLPVVHYLVAEIYRGVRGSAWVSHETNILLFQAGVALTVVSISLLYGFLRPPQPSPDLIQEEGTFPFPVHNLTLLGAGWTLWIFRIVGTWWLVRVAQIWL